MSSTTPLRDDATSLYLPYQDFVEDWQQLQAALNTLGDTYDGERFVWRGQADATWGLTSALYRAVAEQLDRIPTEEDLVNAERNLLKLAREEWRLDGVPGLQLFARMQHVGVPTRLIDATLNPLIAAWFAVAQNSKSDQADGRLFAFTVREKIQLDSKWNGNTPRWHWSKYRDLNARLRDDWGTGLGRRVWQPPALHARIPAQSAAFLLDGVPIEGPPNALARLQPDDVSTWTAQEIRTVASIPVRFARVRRRSLPESKGLVFTYRISAEAKAKIRHQLEDRLGYRFATIYADIEGLAEYVRNSPETLVHQ